ncbi:MAG: NAD(P)-dependent glycerol-3-phosphate dehydrogenase [Dehalococcoidia bacterium]|nr:NAD(P)-dependent glycerol-3-phosphate dehydrogenase [Dehalococcoidia bacterium]
MATFAVVGATSWGATLAARLAGNGHMVHLLVRSSAEAEHVDARRGLERLPALVLPPTVEVVRAAGFAGTFEGVLFAVPAQAMETSAAAPVPRTVPVLSAAKGIDLPTGRRMSEVLVGAGWPEHLVGALSGPNLSHEVAAGLPAAAVVAARDDGAARFWQEALSGGFFRVYRSDDLTGVEVAGALKNVVAIAAGICAGLGLGANAIAALMTRGLAEMTRFGVVLGARPLTFQGLAGVGDLAATCFSPLSRNRRLGELLAAGTTLSAALAAIGEAVEGAATAPVALRLAGQRQVDMPVTQQVCGVLEGRLDVREAAAQLLARALTTEASTLP